MQPAHAMTMPTRPAPRGWLALALLPVILLALAAPAQANSAERPLRIGLLNVRSGAYAIERGSGTDIAAKIAIAEAGGKIAGRPVELLVGDHRNSVEIALDIARKWFDADQVDMIFDIPHSPIALALAELTAARNKVMLVSGAASSDLTGKNCTPNTIHWTYDSWSEANSTARRVTETFGKSWFFLAADNSFGEVMVRDATTAIQAAGGKIVGTVRHPLNPPSLEPQLKAAIDSKAEIVALANNGPDAIQSIMEATKIGLWRTGQRVIGFTTRIIDVHILGLQRTQGLLVTAAFYWDLNDDTRHFSAKFAEMQNGYKPTAPHAGVYSALTHYFKAVAALGGQSGDGAAVVRQMKAMPTADSALGTGMIRVDGRKIHPLYLFEVKKPRESAQPWDYYRLLRTTPANEAFRPLEDGGCPLVSKG